MKYLKKLYLITFLISLREINYSDQVFRPNHYCQNELISIVHNIYTDFYSNPSLEVKGNFLEISKTFEAGWYKGLLFQYFRNNRFQRVVVNGQLSFWSSIIN